MDGNNSIPFSGFFSKAGASGEFAAMAGRATLTILLVYLLRRSLVNSKPPASSRDILQHPGGIKRKGQQPLLLVKNSTHASANRQ